MKSEIVRIPLEPEQKEQLRVLSFETRLSQAELFRQAMAYFLASGKVFTSQDQQEIEGAAV